MKLWFMVKDTAGFTIRTKEENSASFHAYFSALKRLSGSPLYI
jgi:hypothetical protein